MQTDAFVRYCVHCRVGSSENLAALIQVDVTVHCRAEKQKFLVFNLTTCSGYIRESSSDRLRTKKIHGTVIDLLAYKSEDIIRLVRWLCPSD